MLVNFPRAQTAEDQVAQIPTGLRVIVKDSQHSTVCSLPVGANQNQDVSSSGRLVDTSSLYTAKPVDGGSDCYNARQNATYIGFEAEADDISFCLDNVRLLYRSA